MFFPTLHLGNDALREKLCILFVKVCLTSSEHIIMEVYCSKVYMCHFKFKTTTNTGTIAYWTLMTILNFEVEILPQMAAQWSETEKTWFLFYAAVWSEKYLVRQTDRGTTLFLSLIHWSVCLCLISAVYVKFYTKNYI